MLVYTNAPAGLLFPGDSTVPESVRNSIGGYEVTLDSPGPFDDPWQGYPGGNPFPVSLSAGIPFPRFGTYVTIPRDLKMPYINQRNLSLQRQVGADRLFAANYIGSHVIDSRI